MQERINNLKKEIQEKLSSTIDLKNLNELKNIYLSKKGPVQ